MSLFKKKIDADLDLQELSERLQESEKKEGIFLLTIQTLITFIKKFSFDLKEIDAEGFKKNLDDLTGKFSSEKTASKLASFLEKYKKIILSYIDQEKTYLDDREAEFRNIIDILTKALSTLDIKNQDFNQKIFEQSEKMEQITLLDDIKKIKVALSREIDQMREAIREKESYDAGQVEVLSKKVVTLKNELQKAKSESLKDGLTGINNRLSLDRHLRKLVEQNLITATPFSMFILDIDNFKTINDSYGHQAGDRILIATVQKCKDSIRKDDFLARYGGEEFVAILQGASLRNAKKKGDNIRKAISTTRYSLDGEKNKGSIISFTVSIGVSIYKKGDTVKSVVERADKALYAAKATGKNRVVSEKELGKTKS